MNIEKVRKFKISLVGDSQVGKTALCRRLKDNTFSENYSPTIGVDFVLFMFDNEGETHRFQIWDTAGQERFRSITSSYYRDSYGIIVVFDITNRESFDHLQRWFADIDEHAMNNARKVLVGNKCDLSSERAIDYDKAKQYADSLQIPYIETSAKYSTNIEQIFKTLTIENTSNAPIVEPINRNINVSFHGKMSNTSSGFC